jgi:hypothetical protein
MTNQIHFREIEDVGWFSAEKYNDIGLFIGKYENLDDCSKMRELLIESGAFEAETNIREEGLHGPLGGKGRWVVHESAMEHQSTQNPTFAKIIELRTKMSESISEQVNTLFKGANCSLKSGYCQTTYFQSIAELAQVQMAHRDVNHLTDFKNQIMILLAIQDETEFAIIKRSHKYHSDQHFNQGIRNWTTASKFKLKKGQFIAFHPKAIHMGWTCTTDNYRVHFYLGKQPKSNFNIKNANTVKVVTEKCFGRITGVNKTKHLQEFGANYRNRKRVLLIKRQAILASNKKLRV